jgi:hypothetical protein
MAKITVNKLVNLILEQIKKDQLAPDRPMFFSNLNDVVAYYGFNHSEQSHETEMAEMANIVKEYRKLTEPLRISIDEISPETRGSLPKIISLDPDTNEFVEDMIIGNEINTLPNGVEMLKFQNYGEEGKLDRGKKIAHYILLPENIFYKHPPRNVKMGSQYVPKNLELEPGGETEDEKAIRLKRLSAIKENRTKRYGIFPIINDLFSRHEILDHLDICLIPETWASPLRTEHTKNVIRKKKFGTDSPEIDVDFYASRDLKDIDSTVNAMLDLRAQLALGEAGMREREVSAHVPRRHANYIYRGGNWAGKQRVHDKEFFKSAGGKTMVYTLNSKNIQEGEKEINIESILHLTGNIAGRNYVLNALFNVTLNARNKETGEGQERGQLINPITVSLSKPIPRGIDQETFNLDNNIDFFIDQGRTINKQRTGLLPDLMNKLGQSIMETIDPDDVQEKVVRLAQEFAEVDTPEEGQAF